MKKYEILQFARIDNGNKISLKANGKYVADGHVLETGDNTGRIKEDELLKSPNVYNVHKIKRLEDGQVFTLGCETNRGVLEEIVITSDGTISGCTLSFIDNTEDYCDLYYRRNNEFFAQVKTMKTFEILAYNCTSNIYQPHPDQTFVKVDDTDKFDWRGLSYSLDYIEARSDWYHPYTIKRESDGLILSIGDVIKLQTSADLIKYKIVKFNIFERNNIKDIQIELKSLGNHGNNTILLDNVRSSMLINPKITEVKKEVVKKEPKVLFITEDNIKVYNKKHPQLYWIHKETLEKGKDEANTLDHTYDPDYYYFRYFRNRNHEYKELKQKLKANV